MSCRHFIFLSCLNYMRTWQGNACTRENRFVRHNEPYLGATELGGTTLNCHCGPRRRRRRNLTSPQTGIHMDWRHRMGLQSQLIEPIPPFWKQARRWVFKFNCRMIETEGNLLDQGSVDVLEVIQSKQVCLQGLIPMFMWSESVFISDLNH